MHAGRFFWLLLLFALYVWHFSFTIYDLPTVLPFAKFHLADFLRLGTFGLYVAMSYGSYLEIECHVS